MPSLQSSHLVRSVSAKPVAHQSEAAAKRNVSKLQKVIVNGLQDVKAQNLMVFDTEHLSSLFERVIIASGTSHRQTKALAKSVLDAVREAGFPKPRVEGEDNGEWIIVDCGSAVVHIMQPAIRQYYHLEDIWGEKPVRLKHAAAEKQKNNPNHSLAAKNNASSATKSVASKVPVKTLTQAPVKKAAAKKSVTQKAAAQKSAPRSAAKKTPVKTTHAKKSA